MKKYIIVYYDNRYHRFGNMECNNATKSEVVEHFNDTVPLDCAIINIIEL